MIYHSFPALSRYCPSNYGPCGNHMTPYINLKQQEDKGVIYTRGRDGEHRHNKDTPKQDTGTLSPAQLMLTKPMALWDIWARQCKKAQPFFFFPITCCCLRGKEVLVFTPVWWMTIALNFCPHISPLSHLASDHHKAGNDDTWGSARRRGVSWKEDAWSIN